MVAGVVAVLTFGVARAEPVELGCVELSVTTGPHLDEATVRNLLHGARPCGETRGLSRRRADPSPTLRQLPPWVLRRQPELKYILVAPTPSEVGP